MSAIKDFQDKVRRMSPMQRLFTSAALAVPVYAARVGLELAAGPAIGGLGGLALSLAAILFVQSYADHRMGAYNVFGMPLSKDGIHNFGAYLASSMLVAPSVVGAAIGLVVGAVGGHASLNSDMNETFANAVNDEPAAIVQEAEAPMIAPAQSFTPA